MLSGIGDPESLASVGIRCIVELPGVGRHLQDRYEVGVVNRLAKAWPVLEGARFERGDPLYTEWTRGKGMYTSNGAALAVLRRSHPDVPLPDLVHLAFLSSFRGYFPGYSKLIADSHQYLTWAILKAHTGNEAGRVTLCTADPRDTPDILFNFFEGDAASADLAAVVEGIRFARKLSAHLIEPGVIDTEVLPGPDLETQDQLERFVRDHAWGHHAAGTCRIGPREEGGVLDGTLRVHGTRGLRVADASVFPRIPGTFIASATMMVGERAAELLLA
jgi:choline dehydrogenase-like flavoprotein